MAAPAPPAPIPAVPARACAGGPENRAVGCNACACNTFVLGTTPQWPASSASACGRASCGHTFHEHLSGNGGTPPPPVVPNQMTVPTGSHGFYVGYCDQMGCVRLPGVKCRLDIGVGNTPLYHHTFVQNQQCGHATRCHRSKGLRAGSETGPEFFTDSEHEENLVKLQSALDGIDQMQPVKRALMRYENLPSLDNFNWLYGVIDACHKYKTDVKDVPDDLETDAEREFVQKQGETMTRFALDVLAKVAQTKCLEEDVTLLKYCIVNFMGGKTEPAMHIMGDVAANMLSEIEWP